MTNAYIIGEDGPREILCPRCRAEANWRYLDAAKDRVEVTCADCGVFDLPRVDFERAETDIANELG